MFSMEFCGGAMGTCLWCHSEGGLSSRGTSLRSGGRDQDSDWSGCDTPSATVAATIHLQYLYNVLRM
jgi:hypothetical protein